MANTTFQNLAIYIAHELNQITSFVNENTTGRPPQTTLISTEESVRLSSDNSIVDLINNTVVSGQTSLDIRVSTAEEIRAQQIGDLAFDMSTNTQSLQERISNEESNYVAERATLNTRVSTATSTRVSSDLSVLNKIDSDISTMTSGRESLIQQAVNDLVNGAPSTVDTLNEIASLIVANDAELSTILSNQVVIINGINADESQRISADDSFDARLSSLELTVGGGESSLNTRISTAESTREDAEDSLNTRITVEETTFSGEQSVLISKEESKDVRIFADISTRISQINSLEDVELSLTTARVSAFDQLENDYISGDTSLTDRLDLFTSTETGTFTSLEERLSIEEAGRASGDTDANADLTSIETRVSIDEDNLASYQNALGGNFGADIVTEYSTEFRFTTLPLVSGREIEVGTNYFADSVEEIYGTLYDVLFNDTGFTIYEIFDIGINQIDLSVAGNVTSTRTFVQSVTVEDLGTSLLDGYFKPDGTKFYGLLRNGKIWEYTLSTAWDISTLQFNAELDVLVHGTMPLSIDFNTAGTKLFYGEQVSETLYEYDLSVAWDITTGVYNGVNTPLI